MVESTEANRRDAAVYLLKNIRENGAVTLLEQLLYDSEPVIRRNVIRALAFQGMPGNARILSQYLEQATDAEEEQLVEKAKAFLEQQHRDQRASF